MEKIEKMMEKTACNINTLAQFCGKRDVEALTSACLKAAFRISKADVMVLFGGSILAGGDVLAQAMREDIAKTYLIVGGAGHTTETLRQRVHREHPDIETAGLPEAEVFNLYLKKVYNCQADFLETKSTNCGNNITYLLDLLKENHIPFQNIILCQDATMQHRMEAGLRKYTDPEVQIINFATYHAEAVERDGKLTFKEEIHGMWEMDRYVNLLMGEIPRLTDDANGYGPQGKDYIAHVEVPEEAKNAFKELKKLYEVREANPLYAS